MSVERPRVLVVQHEDDGPPALLGQWLVEAGCDLDVRRPYAGEELPALEGYAALLVLGGAMGANDDAEHPWLTPTKELFRAAAADGVPALGVCLGHQLAAVALGGVVERNPRGQQLGVLEVGWDAAASADDLLGPVVRPVRGVHWNSDVVTRLPAGAVLLATAPTGEVQVARHAPTVWGVQLHPEVDAAVLQRWAASDEGSHDDARDAAQVAVVQEVAGARAELDAAWRPLAQALTDLARAQAG